MAFLLLAAGVLMFFSVFFSLADYGWERKKCRGLDALARPSTFGMRSERAEYEWYSWIRYLVIMLLTYVNTVGVIDSEAQNKEGLRLPSACSGHSQLSSCSQSACSQSTATGIEDGGAD